jgi:hypothetical protein
MNLRKNPIVEICKKTNMVFNLMSLTQNLPNNNTNMPEKNFDKKRGGAVQTKDQRAQPIDQNLAITKQLVDNLLTDLTKLNSVEIVGEVLNAPGLQAVFSSKTNYFLDQNGSEIIDGEFKVLGKIVRVIKTENEGSINLLRKTSLSVLDSKSFELFTESLQNANTAGLKIPKMVAELKGPLIQVIPISIFT